MTTQKLPRRLISLVSLIFTLMAVQPARAVKPAEAQALMVAGTVVLAQGDVAVRRGGTEQWEKAQPAQTLRARSS
jgi:hypothetical protein